jgi:hypothetical protein
LQNAAGQGLRFLVDADELSASEKELVFGRALRRVFRWARSSPAPW